MALSDTLPFEKGITSLMNHLVDCYIESSLPRERQTKPKQALNSLRKILKLMTH